MKSGQQTILTIIVWLAPVLALPLYFAVFINAGLSAGVPNATFTDLLVLGIGPVISLLLWLAILAWGKVPVWRFLGMFIPVLLSLAELAFAFLFWQAG